MIGVHDKKHHCAVVMNLYRYPINFSVNLNSRLLINVFLLCQNDIAANIFVMSTSPLPMGIPPDSYPHKLMTNYSMIRLSPYPRTFLCYNVRFCQVWL